MTLSGIREIRDGVYWIQECNTHPTLMDEYTAAPPDWFTEGQNVHLSTNAFFIDGDQTLLFDTLTPKTTDGILSALEELLDGAELDYLVPSHPEVAHAGNAPDILEAYPDATLVGTSFGEKHELYNLDQAIKVAADDTIDLGGFEVKFQKASFPDHAMSHWMYERNEDVFFVADWLGFPHMETDCLTLVGELPDAITVEQLAEFHGRAMHWMAYADPTKTHPEIDDLIDRYGSSMLAPAHGLVIDDEHAAEIMTKMKGTVEFLSERGRRLSVI